MKSKQLNFFIVPSDYGAINKFFEKNEIKLFWDKALNGARKNDKEILGSNDVFQIFLSQDEFSKHIYTRDTDSGIKYYYIVSSYLVEFSIGGFYPYDKSALQRARFYYIQDFYEDGNSIAKSEIFINWAENVIKEFKSTFLVKYSKERDFWYSKNAIDWIERNEAQLVDGGQQWKSNIQKC